MVWEPRDGRSPYGQASKGGNVHDIWHKMHTPCPTCGSTNKRLKIENKTATIICLPSK
jgi:predicted nucleic acid-binding Zn ribbon protein